MANGIDWFRWHHGSITDPKFQLIARKSGQRLGDVIAVWAYLLESASAAETRGTIDGIDCEAVDCLIQADEGTTAAIMDAMTDRGLINDGLIVSWQKRQPKREREDDKSTARVQAFRERQRQSETSNAAKRQETPREEKSREEERREEEIREESDSISVLAPPTKARRRQQLPPDFYPNETGINAAGQKGINVAIELEKFRNYHQGKGSVMADWQAAWRTWVGNARPAMTQTRGKQLDPAWAAFYARSGSNVIDTEAKVIE